MKTGVMNWENEQENANSEYIVIKILIDCRVAPINLYNNSLQNISHFNSVLINKI